VGIALRAEVPVSSFCTSFFGSWHPCTGTRGRVLECIFELLPLLPPPLPRQSHCGMLAIVQSSISSSSSLANRNPKERLKLIILKILIRFFI
jgi:hypothetical protein